MFGLHILKNAIATLAANVLGLAGTVAEINTNLRQRAALDGPDTLEVPSLPLSGTASDATQGDPDASAASTPPTSRNGRKRAMAGTTVE